MKSLKEVLIERDGITSEEADIQITQAKINLSKRLDKGEMPMDICEEEFGLEPDYIFDLLE